MPYHRVTAVWYSEILFVVIVISLFITPSNASGQIQESFEGFVRGLRSNAVKGEVYYQRNEGKFDLEPGLKLEEGDFIKTGADGFAELLLHPGNYLRIGADSDFQIFSDAHDKMRLKLNQGSISIEILAREPGSFTSFFYTRAQAYELIRIITPGGEVAITQSGIYRINAGGGRTELIVREGEAVVAGRRVKKKRRASVVNDNVTIIDNTTKLEDALDRWGRERADQLVQANRLLKNVPPWSKKRKEGEETSIDLEGEAEQPEEKISLYVVSAKPGTISFVEAGVDFKAPEKEWEPLTDKSQLETGHALRTADHSFVELTVLPDMYLRLDQNSEVSFEELTNEVISVKLLRGSAILDVARYDRKQAPQITFAGPTTSVAIADEGNYRLDIRAGSDEITVREGKVTHRDRAVGGCHKITGASVTDCDRKRHDNFDFWSEHRGEGQLYNGRNYISMVTHLARIRRARFKNTGFWFQNPGQTNYTFVPFTSSVFRSPYGGNYSTVLMPRRPTIYRIDMSNRPFGHSFPQMIRP